MTNLLWLARGVIGGLMLWFLILMVDVTVAIFREGGTVYGSRCDLCGEPTGKPHAGSCEHKSVEPSR